jgi:glycosyltransferase involved in cell wall biosynthesis
MRTVYFIQSKFPKDPRELNGLFNRWEEYGASVGESTGNNPITIVSLASRLNLKDQFNNLCIVSESSSFLLNLYCTIRDIQSRENGATLVAGDNQIAFLFCFLVKIICPSKIRVQIQFHGDIYSFRMNGGCKGLLRSITSRIALKFSDSIRIVSQFQESEILSISQKQLKRFVVAPIPIDYSKIPLESEIVDNFDIALVGRLQEERGIPEAVSILKVLITKHPNLRVVIVGDGPLREIAVQNLRGELDRGSVQFLGPLFGAELRSIYAQSRVLLSTAPREGYGLTLREGALSGMRIVARDSDGARQASKDFPESFTLFATSEQAVASIPSLLDMDRIPKSYSKFMNYQLKRDKEGLDRLINSWTLD